MNPRKLVNFIKSPTGRMVGFFLGLILSIALIGYFTGPGDDHKPGAKAPDRPLTQPVTPPEQTASYTQERPFQPARTNYAPSRRREQAGQPDTLPEPPESGNHRHTEAPLGIQVYAEAV